MNLRPHKVEFTTTTKNTNYSFATLKMKGIAEDKTTVLWTEILGKIDYDVLATVKSFQTFTPSTSNYTHVAPYLQFELTGATSTTKQTIAGTITVDYFYVLETVNAVGRKQSAGLPNIVGGPVTSGTGRNTEITAGALHMRSSGNSHKSGPDYQLYWNRIDFDASRSSTIYGNSVTVRPDSLATRYFIKY